MKKILLFLTIVYGLAYAQSSVHFSAEEIEYIKTHPTLKLGAHKNWMPISGIGKNGNYEGLIKEYIELISNKTGLKIDVINKTFDKSVNLMQEKSVDILVGDLNDLDLKHKYIPIYTHDVPVVLLMHGEHKHIDNVLELRDKKIAIEKSALYKEHFYSEFRLL